MAKKKKLRNVFGAADEKIHKKPHATTEGAWASIKRAGKRFEDKTYKIEDLDHPMQGKHL